MQLGTEKSGNNFNSDENVDCDVSTQAMALLLERPE